MTDIRKTEIGKGSGFSNGRALLIAVANYPDVRPLPAAVLNDAQEMKAVLTSSEYCGYSDHQVQVLLDEKATLAAIRRELEILVQKSTPDETVVIFFSGHGARISSGGNEISALVPYDCNPSELVDTTLCESELSSALRRIRSHRLLVFIDACHSGSAGSFKDLTEHLELGIFEKSLDRLAEGVGRVIIASSRASETSMILSGAKNSLFTEHLLGALRGDARTHGDGLIRVFEVFNHVAEKVRAELPGRQHPIFKASDLEDNFPVALDRGGVKNIGTIPDEEVGKASWRQLEDIFADLYPAGPQDQDIWMRAGGDLAQLRFPGTGRANWFSALKTMSQGGGGGGIDRTSLLQTALQDFPRHPELMHLIGNNQQAK